MGRGGLIRERPPERSSALRGSRSRFQERLRRGLAGEIGGQKGDAGGHAADGGYGIQDFEGGSFGGGIVQGGGSAGWGIVSADINTATHVHGNYK